MAKVGQDSGKEQKGRTRRGGSGMKRILPGTRASVVEFRAGNYEEG